MSQHGHCSLIIQSEVTPAACNQPVSTAQPSWSRRRVLATAMGASAGAAGLALGLQHRAQAMGTGGPAGIATAPDLSLRTFDQGRLIEENGRRLRLFELEAGSLTMTLAPGVRFKAWGLNGRVPGPTLRASEGERIRVVFRNGDSTLHSLHFHGVHPAAMDGITPIRQGETTVYEFDLPSAGLYPYHCHVPPVARHVGKGMFGLLVVDPRQGRADADELVLTMGAYDLNQDGRNELYAFNGFPDQYMQRPIRIRQNGLVRVYLLNMVELDTPLTFHIHANTFKVLRSGWTETTDVVTLGMAERQILEFRYPFNGRYMFHPHQDQIAERGCMGQFEVVA